jgi:hypothetical protein
MTVRLLDIAPNSSLCRYVTYKRTLTIRRSLFPKPVVLAMTPSKPSWAYQLGYESYGNSMELEENPFITLKEKPKRDDWEEGWKKAKYDDPLSPIDDDVDEADDPSLSTGFEPAD